MARLAGGLAAAVLTAAACGPAPQGGEEASGEAARPARVFAASSLTDVLTMVGAAYAAHGHAAPVFNFAASSELARQIEQGADADLFISADEAWMDYLEDRSLIDPQSRLSLLANDLVLAAPSDRAFALTLEPGMDLADALKGGKLAIAHPQSVPAGRYARQALEHFGAWDEVEPMTVHTENVRAALRFVEQGEASAGIVYATDAKAAGDRIAVIGVFPPDSHTPITYPAALTPSQGASPAGGFFSFLRSDEAHEIFRAAGFGRARESETRAYLPPK